MKKNLIVDCFAGGGSTGRWGQLLQKTGSDW
jgi:hypothetical protein